MKLTNEITVPAPIDEAWDLMLDVERVAPCLPGASVEASEGDEYKGSMKVKIGPIVSNFDGTLKIDEADEQAHRAVMSAKARDSRGKGSANATITSTLERADEGTRVTVETDLRVTGPAASFGRGVMQDVSAMLMTQFADCLATKLGREAPSETGAEAAAPEAPAETAAAAAGDGSEDGGAVARAQALPADVPEPPPAQAETSPPAEPEIPAPAQAETPAPAEPGEDNVLDLGSVGRKALGRRAAAPAVAVFVLFLLVLLLRRRRG
jgi:carbon monoxide dehydrogenase subunit G